MANFGGNTVSVISTSSNAVVATISVGSHPDGVAFASSNGDIYVANYGGNTVSVISTSSNAIVGSPISVGSQPSGVAYASNGDIYVTNTASNTVSVISTSTNTVVGSPISVGTGPLGLLLRHLTATYTWPTMALMRSPLFPPLPFLTLLVLATLDVGQSELFTASAVGGTGAYSSSTGYQWYVGGVVQSGQTASTFSFVPGSAGSYSITVTVTDTLGATSPQSTAASVTVDSALVAPTATPTPGTVNQGQTSALTSTSVSTGTSPYVYQWFEMAPGRLLCSRWVQAHLVSVLLLLVLRLRVFGALSFRLLMQLR